MPRTEIVSILLCREPRHREAVEQCVTGALMGFVEDTKRTAAARPTPLKGLPLFLSGEESKRGAGESIRLAELILQKLEIGGSDVLRMTDEQGKDGGVSRHLSHEG